jgi:hypothetical protein
MGNNTVYEIGISPPSPQQAQLTHLDAAVCLLINDLLDQFSICFQFFHFSLHVGLNSSENF